MRDAWIARGTMHAEGRDCTRITYRAAGGSHILQASLALGPQPHAHVPIDGAPAFPWPR